jgi:hypothetical protein
LGGERTFAIIACIPVDDVVSQYTLLGGINMVDYNPFSGDYSGTVVRNNTILGGFASDDEDEVRQTKGENDEDVIIK